MPARANAPSAVPAVPAERRAMSLRADGELAVMSRNRGITANGSPRKKAEVTATSTNASTCIVEWNIDDSFIREPDSAKITLLRAVKQAQVMFLIDCNDFANSQESLHYGHPRLGGAIQVTRAAVGGFCGRAESAPGRSAERTAPGTALDLACGTGRNSLWLAQHGWRVTAVDGPTSIDVLCGHASELGVEVDARVADLEKSEYAIESSTWDLIVISYYLQRSLFEPAKQGVVPGGIVLAIVHIIEPGEEPTEHRLRPGELASYFQGWEILHHHEGTPNDRAHQRSVAEIVALRPNLGSRDR